MIRDIQVYVNDCQNDLPSASGIDSTNNYTKSACACEQISFEIYSADDVPYRISAKGFGETQLENECKDGVDCTKEQHQQYRRTECRVVLPPEQDVEIRNRGLEGQKSFGDDSITLASTQTSTSNIVTTTQQVDKKEQKKLNQKAPSGYYAVLGSFKDNARDFMNQRESKYDHHILLGNNGFYRVVHFLHEKRMSAIEDVINLT